MSSRLGTGFEENEDGEFVESKDYGYGIFTERERRYLDRLDGWAWLVNRLPKKLQRRLTTL